MDVNNQSMGSRLQRETQFAQQLLKTILSFSTTSLSSVLASFASTDTNRNCFGQFLGIGSDQGIEFTQCFIMTKMLVKEV